MPIHDFDRIIERRGGDSAKWNAYPEDILPMWVADTDFMAPEPVVKALRDRAAHGIFGYSDSKGASLKAAVGHWMHSRFNWQVSPDWITFSPSVVTALALCVVTFTAPGDNVLFLTPSYPPFFRIPRAHGRNPLSSSLLYEQGRYVMDLADLDVKMADSRTRLLFLCNPHNPTGRVFSREELLELGALCLKHNVLVISDEIHGDYVFPGHTHIPFPSLSPELAERTLVTVNPSKTFNIADLHTSAVLCANPNLLARFVTAAEGMALHGNALGQIALETAYRECAWYADQVAAYVKANIDYAATSINERLPGIRADIPESTFLLWLDCREMGLAQKDLELFFLNKAKLALNSGTDYGSEGTGFMRLNLGCPRSRVTEALSRLEKATGV